MNPTSAQQTTDEIFNLYERYGNEAYGEEVTQTAHMVQSAQLAEEEGYDDEVILAAFFHDIGHSVCFRASVGGHLRGAPARAYRGGLPAAERLFGADGAPGREPRAGQALPDLHPSRLL